MRKGWWSFTSPARPVWAPVCRRIRAEGEVGFSGVAPCAGRFSCAGFKSCRFVAAPWGVRELQQRVLSRPEDAEAWQGLAVRLAARDEPVRAAACLDALEVARPRERRNPAWRATREQARQRSTRSRSRLHTSLAAPDVCRVSVIVLGSEGEAGVEASLESLRSQSLDARECQWIVAQGRHEGLMQARGRYVAYLEGGAQLFPDHLAVLADHLDRVGLPLAYSRAVQRGGAPSHRAPLLAREAAGCGLAPTPCVLHGRRALRTTGSFEPELGRAQDWHLWRRIMDRFAVDHVPIVSAEVPVEEDRLEHRFDALLVRLQWEARARRWQQRAHARLAQGDPGLASLFLARAWNLGLGVEPFVATLTAIAGRSRQRAGDLVDLAAGEVESFVRGPFRAIARGSQARRTLARHGHLRELRVRYAEAAARGLDRARRHGLEA